MRCYGQSGVKGVAICDDENAIVNQIETIIGEVCGREKIPAEIGAFYSGEALQKQVASGARYDLIFWTSR